MTLNTFISTYNGKKVEYHSYSSGALNQCVDLFHKLTVMLGGSLFPYLSRLFHCSVITKIKTFSTNHQTNAIWLFERSIRDLCDTPVSIARVIKRVLLMGSYSEIVASVVKSISIYVVNFHSIGRISYSSVHKHPLATSLSSIVFPILSSSSISATSQPLIFTQPLVITIINYCSITLSQLDVFHSNYYSTSTHLWH